MSTKREISTDDLGERLRAVPGFEAVRDAAAAVGANAFVVGGAVRDALIDAELSAPNLDLVVVGDPAALIDALPGEATRHERFETATVETEEGSVDIARARTETYEHPGALPTIFPGRLDEDLRRRDFTINSMAAALAEPDELIDPLGGIVDLRNGVLRVLHRDSFFDDPTRALRAARYAARLDLEPDENTLALLREADLSTVSADRVAADLGRIAAERDPRAGFELLDAWGLVSLAPAAADLIDRVVALLEDPEWADVAPRPVSVLAAAGVLSDRVQRLATLAPDSPAAAVEAAKRHSGVELVLARALGASWLDDYVEHWRRVELEISGEDLLAAGVSEGPAIGRGLAAALRAKLDGEVEGRDDELRVAMAAAAAD